MIEDGVDGVFTHKQLFLIVFISIFLPDELTAVCFAATSSLDEKDNPP